MRLIRKLAVDLPIAKLVKDTVITLSRQRSMVSYTYMRILFSKALFGFVLITISIVNASVAAEVSTKQQTEAISTAEGSERSAACAGDRERAKDIVLSVAPAEKEQEIIVWARRLATVCPGDEVAIATLTAIIESTDNSRTLALAARTLGEVDYQNALAVEALLEHYQSMKDSAPEDIISTSANSIAFGLGFFGQKNPLAANALIQIIQDSDDYLILDRALRALGEVGQENEEAIALLENTIEKGLLTSNSSIVWNAASALDQVDPGNPKAVSGLVKLFYSLEDSDKQETTARMLARIALEENHTIALLKHYLSPSYSRRTRYWAVDKLGEAGISDDAVISTLIALITEYPISESEDKDDFSTVSKPLDTGGFQVSFVSIRLLCAQQLQQAAVGNEAAIETLSALLSTEKGTTEQELEVQSLLAFVLGALDQSSPQPATTLSAVLEQYAAIREPTYNTPKQLILAAERLADVSADNTQAISALRNLLSSNEPRLIEKAEEAFGSDSTTVDYEAEESLEQYARVQSEAATSLLKMADGDMQAIEALIALLSLQSDRAINTVTGVIKETKISQPEIITALEQLLLTSENGVLLFNAADALWTLDSGNPQALNTLLTLIKDASGSTFDASSAASLLKVVGKGNPDVISELTEVVQNHQNADVRLLAAGVLTESHGDNPEVIALIRDRLRRAIKADN